MRGALLVLLSFANLNLIWSPDVLPNTLFAWTLVSSGNVDYDEFATTSETDERPHSGDSAVPGGRDWPPGFAPNR